MLILFILCVLIKYPASTSSSAIFGNKVVHSDFIEFHSTIDAILLANNNITNWEYANLPRYQFDFEKFYRFVFPCDKNSEDNLKEWSTLKVRLLVPCWTSMNLSLTQKISFNVDFCSYLTPKPNSLDILGLSCQSQKIFINKENLASCSSNMKSRMTFILSDVGYQWRNRLPLKPISIVTVFDAHEQNLDWLRVNIGLKLSIITGTKKNHDALKSWCSCINNVFSMHYIMSSFTDIMQSCVNNAFPYMSIFFSGMDSTLSCMDIMF